MEEHDLRRNPLTPEDSLIELVRPARVGTIVEVAGEREVAASPPKPWGGKEFSLRVRGRTAP
jgi:hypothetical protein